MPQSYRTLADQIEEDIDLPVDDAHRAALNVCRSLPGDPEGVREVLDALGILEPLRQKRAEEENR